MRFLLIPSGLLTTLFALLVATFPAAAGGPSPDAERQARADALERDIAALVRRLDADRLQHDEAEEALARTERRIRTLADQRDELARRIAALRERIGILDRKDAEASERLPALRDELGKAMRVRQRLSRRPRAAIGLGQDDAASARRMLVYFDHVLAAQSVRLESLRVEIDELANARELLERESSALEQTLADHRRLEAELANARGEREAQLARLASRIEGNESRLAAKRDEQARLKELLAGIESIQTRAEPPAPAPTENDAPIALRGLAHSRGTLPLPADGEIATRFRQPDPLSGVASNGVVIATALGADVRSISAGQVVYSDWFRGFGLLLVLDHGEGFMSLYGHNSELLYPVGATVAGNTPVARAGSTSGRNRPGVYFEIRRRGEALDPLAWCAPRHG